MDTHPISAWCLQKPEGGIGPLDTGISQLSAVILRQALASCELSWKSWQLNLAPLEEQVGLQFAISLCS